ASDKGSGIVREKAPGSATNPASSAQYPASSIQHPESTSHAPALHAPMFWYTLSLFLFALGLMSKPMVVTLPCVLLLIDFWPLQRFQSSTTRSDLSSSNLWLLLREKIPFFALTVAASVVTYLVQGAA